MLNFSPALAQQTEMFRDRPAMRMLIDHVDPNGDYSFEDGYKLATEIQKEAVAKLLNPKSIFASEAQTGDYLLSRDMGLCIDPYCIAQARGALQYHFSAGKFNKWIDGGSVEAGWDIKKDLAESLGLDSPSSYQSLIATVKRFDPTKIPKLQIGKVGVVLDLEINSDTFRQEDVMGQLARNGLAAAAPYLLVGAIIYDLELAYGTKFPDSILPSLVREIKDTIPKLSGILKIRAIENLIAAAEYFEQNEVAPAEKAKILNCIGQKNFQKSFLRDIDPRPQSSTVSDPPSSVIERKPASSTQAATAFQGLTFSPEKEVDYVDPFQTLLDQHFPKDSRIRKDPKYSQASGWLNRVLQGQIGILQELLDAKRTDFASFPLVKLVDAVRAKVKELEQLRLSPAKVERLVFAKDANGRSPYQEFLKSIANERDKRSKLSNLLSRLDDGNTGSGHPLAGYSNLHELRDHSFGLRIYYTWRNNRPVILLAGDKASQSADIQKAAGMLRLL